MRQNLLLFAAVGRPQLLYQKEVFLKLKLFFQLTGKAGGIFALKAQ